MRGNRRWADELERYKNGETAPACAGRLGCKLSTFYIRARADGICKGRGRPRTVLPDGYAQELEAYKNGKSGSACAAELGLNTYTFLMNTRRDGSVRPCGAPHGKRGPNSNSKISAAQRKQIKERFERGETQTKMADEYGVTRQYISWLIKQERP